MTGCFVKGKWIDLNMWDERYGEYYCGPCRKLWCNMPEDRNIEPFYSCHCDEGNRKICNMWDADDKVYDVLKPEWCKMRK